MAEKRGHTVKLLYPFPTQKCLEIELNGTWYRVTAGEFRCFGGKRRIIVDYDDNRKPIYEDYYGPVFKDRTNYTVDK